jgi:heme exporter protein D
MGYAPFIWSAYGATALVVAGLILRAVLDHRAQLRALARLEASGLGLGVDPPSRERATPGAVPSRGEMRLG